MIRNLKTLGLALVAVCALGAVAATAASAQQGVLTTDGERVTLLGKQTGAVDANSLTAFGLTTICPGSTYTGHKYEVTSHVPLTNGDDKVTITPHYVNCTTSGFITTVDLNGCDYAFDLGATNAHGGESYAVTTTVHCPDPKKTPVVTVFGSAAKHANNEPFCEVEVTPETSYAGLSARDTQNGKVDITGTIEIKEAHKRSPTGSILCPAATGAVTLHVDAVVEGLNNLGETTPISLSH